MPLKPTSLAEWAMTDMAWWHELAAAKSAYEQGRQAAGETKRAIAAATAHRRR